MPVDMLSIGEYRELLHWLMIQVMGPGMTQRRFDTVVKIMNIAMFARTVEGWKTNRYGRKWQRQTYKARKILHGLKHPKARQSRTQGAPDGHG